MNEYELFLYETSIETLRVRSVRERFFPSGRRSRCAKSADHETSMARRNTAELKALVASVRGLKEAKA